MARMNWKIWTIIGVILVALLAVYTFASPDGHAAVPSLAQATVTDSPRSATIALTTPGVPRIRKEWLDPQSGSYRSSRDLFSYVEPPPPPPPQPPPPPAPPKDSDHDGVPDVRDNCPDVSNADQADLDRNGIGDACQSTEVKIFVEAPHPPEFSYKYIGTFGPKSNAIATFSGDGELINVRVGETFGNGKFILRNIGIESADIGFPGFPMDMHKRVPIGQ